jgi:DNA mismatch endonuclease (patch repair protein)
MRKKRSDSVKPETHRARLRTGYPQPSNAAATNVMQGNRRTGTKPEIAVRRALHAHGLRYRVDLPINVAGIRVRPDIVFTKRRVAVFIDGCFWHGCPLHSNQPRTNPSYWETKIARNKERDIRVNAALEDNGWTVVRAWEHEPPEQVADVVLALLDSLRSQ